MPGAHDALYVPKGLWDRYLYTTCLNNTVKLHVKRSAFLQTSVCSNFMALIKRCLASVTTEFYVFNVTFSFSFTSAYFKMCLGVLLTIVLKWIQGLVEEFLTEKQSINHSVVLFV